MLHRNYRFTLDGEPNVTFFYLAGPRRLQAYRSGQDEIGVMQALLEHVDERVVAVVDRADARQQARDWLDEGLREEIQAAVEDAR